MMNAKFLVVSLVLVGCIVDPGLVHPGLVHPGLMAHGQSQEKKVDVEKSSRADRNYKDSKNVLVKLFYIAMRDRSATKLKALIDPAYIEKHNLKNGFETETIPVNNVYDIQVSPDRKTLMCHLLKDEENTGVVVLNVVQRGRGLFIVPPLPPKGESHRVTPWLLHANLAVN